VTANCLLFSTSIFSSYYSGILRVHTSVYSCYIVVLVIEMSMHSKRRVQPITLVNKVIL